MNSIKKSSSCSPLLSGCELSIAAGSFSPLSALRQSLIYQSELLGIRLSEQPEIACSGLQLNFQYSNALDKNLSTFDNNLNTFDKRIQKPIELNQKEKLKQGISQVKATITPWQNDSQRIADESIMQAACGMMSVHGRAQGQVQALGLPYISTLTACFALQGLLATSVARLRGVELPGFNLSMMTAGLMAVGQYIAGATASEDAECIFPSHCIAEEQPPFISADGVIFELETLSPGPWKAFWQRVGIGGVLAGKGWKAFLMRYAKAISPLPREMKLALSKLTYDEIKRVCEETGVAICPVRSLQQRHQDTDFNGVLQQGPWLFNETSTGFLPASACLSGHHLPLHGIVVVEACRRIQGPMAGHLLSLLGAKVIRVELPGGDPLRGMLPAEAGVSVRFDALNRFKQPVEIDIKSADGQEAIKSLIQSADVFLHNWAPGKAAEYSLDSADLRKINPQLIYAYAGGWGELDTQLQLPGTDFMVQAYSGVAESVGRHSTKPGGSLFTVLDILGGAVSSQGIVAALLSRQLSGDVTRVDTSLLGTASLLTFNHNQSLKNLLTKSSKQNESCLSDESELFGKFNAIYSTTDGELVLSCVTEKNMEELFELTGIFSTTDSIQVMHCLKERIIKKSAREWVNIFANSSIAVAEVVVDLAKLASLPESSDCLSSHPDSYVRVMSPWRMRSTSDDE